MIKQDGSDLYPLELVRIMKDGKIIYDRNARGKSYFFLRFIPEITHTNFTTVLGERLVCSDGKSFRVRV